MSALKNGLFILLIYFCTPLAGFSQNGASIPPIEKTEAPKEEAAYTEAIEKRTSDILAVLELKDAAKVTAVHDAIMAQYRALKDWQKENQAKLKELNHAKGDEAKAEINSIMATRKNLHDKFFSKLDESLSPGQVEKVKDKLTYNKVKVTYDSYCEIINNLTDEEKGKVLELLKEARELAVDGTSAEEKTAIFQKYKGRINNYLSKQGHDVKQAYKDFGDRSRAKEVKNTDDKPVTDDKLTK